MRIGVHIDAWERYSEFREACSSCTQLRKSNQRWGSSGDCSVRLHQVPCKVSGQAGFTCVGLPYTEYFFPHKHA